MRKQLKSLMWIRRRIILSNKKSFASSLATIWLSLSIQKAL